MNEDALRADKDRLVETWLADRAVASHEWRFGDNRLALFARTEERAPLLSLAPDFTPTAAPQHLASEAAELVGWEQPLQRVRAGEPVQATVYVRQYGLPTTLTLALGEPSLAEMSTTLPAADGVTRAPMTLVAPVDAPAGWQPWRLALDGAWATVGRAQVVPRPRARPSAGAATPDIVVNATFGDPPLARLLGYSLDEPITPGGEARVTLFWQASNPTTRSYKVFTHLTDESGRIVTQRDEFPLMGERPTTTWQPGETLVDVYPIAVGDQTLPGSYILKVGFYDPATGERLTPVHDVGGALQPAGEMALGRVELR